MLDMIVIYTSLLTDLPQPHSIEGGCDFYIFAGFKLDVLQILRQSSSLSSFQRGHFICCKFYQVVFCFCYYLSWFKRLKYSRLISTDTLTRKRENDRDKSNRDIIAHNTCISVMYRNLCRGAARMKKNNITVSNRYHLQQKGRRARKSGSHRH